jgi:hypothetical protein
MLVNILVSIFGILIFLFLFWKRLKEDYSAEIIFKVCFYILVGTGAGWALSIILFPVWFFWLAFTGGVLGFAIAFFLLKVKFYETLEAFIIGFLPWLSLIFLKNSVETSSLSSFLGFLAILILTFVSYYFDTHYKKFNWYLSGRIGFCRACHRRIIFLNPTCPCYF